MLEFEPEFSGERRRHPRAEILNGLRATVLSAPIHARVQEISEGGFALETDEVLPAGVHLIRFEFDSLRLEAVAELVHTTRLSFGPAPTYISGFEFLHADAATALAIARLVERIAAACPA
jgi:hypothetical protein